MALIRIEDGIFYLLDNNAPVTALVASRIYPLTIPQNPTLPALTYQIITPATLIAHDGLTGTGKSRYQITAFDTDYDVIIDLMNKVRVCMAGYKGTLGAAPDTVDVYAMIPMDTGYGSYEPVTKRFMRALDFMIWHEENV